MGRDLSKAVRSQGARRAEEGSAATWTSHSTERRGHAGGRGREIPIISHRTLLGKVMKKNVRNVRMAKEPGGAIIACATLPDLRKLRAKLNLATCDLHGASPFPPAKRDPDHMLARRESDVRRCVPEEFAVNVDFAAAR